MDNRNLRSPLLPGGDLVAAVLDREVMTLADRGGASNLVGDRWADLCAEHADLWRGQERPVPGQTAPLVVEAVHRLDATPDLAAAASRRALQNPDLLLLGTHHGAATVQAADAKFSVETARSRQVSPEAVQALLGLRDEAPGLLPEVAATPRVVPGVFLSPDFPLTHLMLRRRHGIMRTTVRPEEVVLVPAEAATFFAPLEGAPVMRPLVELDGLPVDPAESLLAGLYYFRLARAAIGFWLDATKPLLLFDDRTAVDEAAVWAEAVERAASAPTAFGLVRRWNADVQEVRNARAAVDQVAALPVSSKELRSVLLRVAGEAGVETPPSVNQLRRRLGAWYRRELRERVGPLSPPVPDLPAALQEVARAGASLAPRLAVEAERIGRELVADGAKAPADRDLVAAEPG